MQYAICEQRPKHYQINLAPMNVPAIDLAAPIGVVELGAQGEAELLATLQAAGVGGALTVDNIEVFIDYRHPDYLVQYREAKHHISQDWLRLVPVDQLGRRIYNNCD